VKKVDRGGFQKIQAAILKEIQCLLVPPLCPKMEKKNANSRSN
jgi:hypothetical protein